MIVTKGQLKAAQRSAAISSSATSRTTRRSRRRRCNSRLIDDQIDEMNALYQAVKKASDIRFRIYTEVGGEGETRQVDLFRIVPEGSRWPAAAGEAPSNLCRALANFRP